MRERKGEGKRGKRGNGRGRLKREAGWERGKREEGSGREEAKR